MSNLIASPVSTQFPDWMSRTYPLMRLFFTLRLRSMLRASHCAASSGVTNTYSAVSPPGPRAIEEVSAERARSCVVSAGAVDFSLVILWF
ncbi:hypothetical protein CXR34_10625 [Microbacterium hominis]|uniref:Uncharacterized protein n=1 Tax=Microbacterium hominis TaxID=162426 RepID=A0A2K9DYW8_9MICO|nr:hypothetical protein CXR34_10625 [Microbacterium hominis]